MDPISEIEPIIVAVENFLEALDRRSWPAFEQSFSSFATVSISTTPEDDDIVFWEIIRAGWRQVFSAELSRIGPLDPNRGRPIVEVRGKSALVYFSGVPRRSDDDVAISMTCVEGRWLIKHLSVSKLPLRPLAAAAPQTSEAHAAVCQGWFVPVVLAALVAIALLGSLSDRRSAVQLSAAVLAVFFGAVAIMRGELGVWLREASRRDTPLTGSGALGVAIGAAFLVS